MEETDVNYYTDSIVKTDIQVLYQDREDHLSGIEIVLGDVLVRTQVTKYKKTKYSTHESIGAAAVRLGEELKPSERVEEVDPKSALSAFLRNWMRTSHGERSESS